MISRPIRYTMFFVQFSHHCHNIFWHRFPIWLIFIYERKTFSSFSLRTHVDTVAHLLFSDSGEAHFYCGYIIEWVVLWYMYIMLWRRKIEFIEIKIKYCLGTKTFLILKVSRSHFVDEFDSNNNWFV